MWLKSTYFESSPRTIEFSFSVKRNEAMLAGCTLFSLLKIDSNSVSLLSVSTFRICSL